MTLLTIRVLGRRVQYLREESKLINRMLRPLIRETAPGLLEVFGVGFDTAAKLLVAAGDNPERIRTEAAWAHLCGVAPIPATSGKTTRHRLNRGGNRQANSALYHITRMRLDQATRRYMARRLGEGKTWVRSPASSNATPPGKSSNTSPDRPKSPQSGPDPIEPAHTPRGLCIE